MAVHKPIKTLQTETGRHSSSSCFRFSTLSGRCSISVFLAFPSSLSALGLSVASGLGGGRLTG